MRRSLELFSFLMSRFSSDLPVTPCPCFGFVLRGLEGLHNDGGKLKCTNGAHIAATVAASARFGRKTLTIAMVIARRL